MTTHTTKAQGRGAKSAPATTTTTSKRRKASPLAERIMAAAQADVAEVIELQLHAEKNKGKGTTRPYTPPTAREEVAAGNGMTVAELPRFKRHIHPETGEGVHTSWSDCLMTSCTWAGSTEAHMTPSTVKAAKSTLPTEAIINNETGVKSRPNAMRRNEFTHADGEAAVMHGGCAKCGAKKGKRCISQKGIETNFVHSPRMAAWDNS